jgi:hypothetical protein
MFQLDLLEELRRRMMERVRRCVWATSAALTIACGAETTTLPPVSEPLPRTTTALDATAPTEECKAAPCTVVVGRSKDNSGTAAITVEGTVHMRTETHPGNGTKIDVCELALDVPRCFCEGDSEFRQGDGRPARQASIAIWDSRQGGDKCSVANDGKHVRVTGKPFATIPNAYNPFPIAIEAERIDLVNR